MAIKVFYGKYTNIFMTDAFIIELLYVKIIVDPLCFFIFQVAKAILQSYLLWNN